NGTRTDFAVGSTNFMDPDALLRTNQAAGGNSGNAVGSFESDGVPNIAGAANSEQGGVGFFRGDGGKTRGHPAQASGPFYVGAEVANEVGWDGQLKGTQLGFDAARCSQKFGASPN